MAYRIRLLPRAAEDIEKIYRRIIEQAPVAGQRWYNALIERIQSLDTFPERGEVVEALSQPNHLVRKLLFGHKPHTYRIYFEVSGEQVRVLHVRHGARREPKRRSLSG